MNIEFERYINNMIKVLKSSKLLVNVYSFSLISFLVFFYITFSEDYSFIKVPFIVMFIFSLSMWIMIFMFYSNKIKKFTWIIQHYQTDKDQCIKILNQLKGKKTPTTYDKYYANLVKATELLQ